MNLPSGTKRRTRPGSPGRTPRPPQPWRRPRPPTSFPTQSDPLSLQQAETSGEVPARFLLDPKQKHRNHSWCRYGAPAPTRTRPARAQLPPLTWGLRRGAAPGGRSSRRPVPEQQQATEPKGGGAEESPSSPLRRHLLPASGGGCAAEPLPPSLLHASTGPSLQARLRRPPLLQPGPTRPARPLFARGETRGRLPPTAGRRGRRGGSQYIPDRDGAGGGGWAAIGLQVPGAATRRRLRLRTPARGGRRPRSRG